MNVRLNFLMIFALAAVVGYFGPPAFAKTGADPVGTDARSCLNKRLACCYQKWGCDKAETTPTDQLEPLAGYLWNDAKPRIDDHKPVQVAGFRWGGCSNGTYGRWKGCPKTR